jgi:hypothetical protein
MERGIKTEKKTNNQLIHKRGTQENSAFNLQQPNRDDRRVINMLNLAQ